jgi:uncharacterized protein (DUF2336 family)
LTPAAALALEVERATTGKDPAFAAKTVRNVTDLFVRQSIFLREPEINVFDEVLLRLLPFIDLRERIALAERLADLGNAPRKLTQRLALSEPAVAAPVLERSRRLTDEELATIGSTLSSSQIIAIAYRTSLSPSLSDFVISRATSEVLRALALNHGAMLSDAGLASLVDKAKQDADLFHALEGRDDLTPDAVAALMRIAADEARAHLAADLEGLDRRGCEEVLFGLVQALSAEIPLDLQDAYRAARARVREQILGSDLSGETLVEWMAENATPDVVAGLAQLARVGIGASAGAFDAPNCDAVAVLAKMGGLSLETASALFAYKTAHAGPLRDKALEMAAALFDRLSPRTTKSVLRYVATRRTLGGSGRSI